MPSPTVTSAAATTMTKKTMACPPMSPSVREKVTKVRLTALSISSTHMNMISALRRVNRPKAPTPKSSAASTRYQAAGTFIPRPRSGCARGAFGRHRDGAGHPVRPRHERDETRDGDDDTDAGEGPLANEWFDPHRVTPVHAEEHDHEEEEHDDGPRVHDDLHGGEEVGGLGDERNGDAEERHDQTERRVHWIVRGEDAHGTDEDQQRRGREDHDARPGVSDGDHERSRERRRLGIFLRALLNLACNPRWSSGTSSGWRCRGKTLRNCLEPVATSSRFSDWPASAARTPKPRSAVHCTTPSNDASPAGEVARIQPPVMSASPSRQSSQGRRWGKPWSSTSSSALV